MSLELLSLHLLELIADYLPRPMVSEGFFHFTLHHRQHASTLPGEAL